MHSLCGKYAREAIGMTCCRHLLDVLGAGRGAKARPPPTGELVLCRKFRLCDMDANGHAAKAAKAHALIAFRRAFELEVCEPAQ